MVRVVVYHGYYGCDTGCCGHYAEFEDGSQSQFDFDHPWTNDEEERRKWAIEFAQEMVEKKFGKEHVADLDWENCRLFDDC